MTPQDKTPEPNESPADTLKRRAALLGLTTADQQRLRQVVAAFESSADDFVAAFYRHLFAHEETARFLQDAELVERLKLAQRRHFDSMLAANWDENYVQQRRRVGQMHADVGIEPEFFLSGYNQYVQYYFRHFAFASEGDQPRVGAEQLLSVLKAIFLDVGLTLDAYFSQSTQKLRHALDMLWRANVELKHFAQLASHDLKTPLATVANLCDEAIDEFGDEMPAEARQLIEAAKNRTYRMSAMIDELLASSLTEEGSETNNNVASLPALAEAIERVRPVLEAKRISFTAPATTPHVWGNKVRLQEAFYNLLSNAAKFVKHPGGKIEVTAETRADDVLFCVADNGPGIPREERERIFLPFRRLPSHRDLPGSGLGLYFTKNMIEHQEGQIWVESEPGHGARFFIRLKKPGADMANSSPF